MSAKKITTEFLDAFLHCKLKAHLKEAGEQGTRHDYEALLLSRREEARRAAVQAILDGHPEGPAASSVAATAEALRAGPPFVLDALYEDGLFSLKFDGLKRVPAPSQLGPFSYAPVLFQGGEKIGSDERLLLELHGLLLAGVQGVAPSHGFVWHGKGRCSRVALKPGRAEQLLRQLRRTRDAGPPKLVLNDHCQQCEFRQRCHEQAVKEDSLSLLRGVGEKEARAYARKGVLTLTQLAHTFRPRRQGKRAAQKGRKRYHALQALAVRDRRVYVFGTPQVPQAPVRIYLDVEGVPDEGHVYLIGMVVCEGGEERRLSFWADGKDQEADIFQRFLDEACRHDDFRVFCYGGYERKFLERMRKAASNQDQVDRVLDRLVNVLSVVYDHLYFPCHSNGLKDVAACLGFSWSEPDASGIQSLVWRARWEETRDEAWKQRLLAYNLEDCAALKKVVEFLSAVCPGTTPLAETGPAKDPGAPVARVEELDQLGTVTRRGKLEFFHPDFEHVNKCAHFDYHRGHVHARTRKPVRTARRRSRKYPNRALRLSQKIRIVDQKCPSCGGTEVSQWERGKRAAGLTTGKKRAFDLVLTAGGIKRRVIECQTSVHECGGCGNVFIPDRYRRLAKHFHGLMSWTTYQQVAHRINPNTLKEMLKDFFGLAVCQQEINEFKSMMARFYQPCHDGLLAKAISGKVLHVDETQVRLRHGKGYVWVLTTADEVVYLYRPTREGDFLLELLKDFRGVLVSDFYAAYDAIDCPQQKCLIHLMRDMNQDLLNNPFDEELQSITGPFGTLIRAIVADIDQYGLDRSHLSKHEKAVAGYFEAVVTRVYSSDAAEALRVRLVKNRDKLFTFIGHDGVAWHNNNAENAIRQFAYYREEAAGLLSEAGLKDYLVLLSICQTCRYKGVSFLKFLLSAGQDVDAFCMRPGRRRAADAVEVYPEGVGRPDFGPPAVASTEELQRLQGEWWLVEWSEPDGSVARPAGGGERPEGGPPPPALTIQADVLSTNSSWANPPGEFRGRYRASYKRKPHRVNFLPLDAPATSSSWYGRGTPGIYDLDGDILRICIPAGINGRPASFEPGKGNWVYTLRRKR